MNLTLNKSNEYEILGTVIMDKEFKEKHPIAYQAKKEELMEENGQTEREAEATMSEADIELELYYEKGRGLFAIESEACESSAIYSPYTGEPCRDMYGKLNPYSVSEAYKAMGESLKNACIEHLEEEMGDGDYLPFIGKTICVHCDQGEYGYHPRCAVRSIFKEDGVVYLELDECPRYPFSELFPDEMGEILKAML